MYNRNMLKNKSSQNNIIKIAEDIFCIEVPLPNNPLKQLNAYLILGDRNLLIDTGFNMTQCKEALVGGLTALEVDLNSIDIFITHLHGDHCGLLTELHRDGMTVYSSEPDGKIISDSTEIDYWTELEGIFIKHGYPKEVCMTTLNIHPGRKYNHKGRVEFTYLKNDDVLNVGNRKLRCVHTPGHSPGHLCLYDEDNKILFSGDHVLGNITPNICPEVGFENPLTSYFESLENIKKLDVNMAYPGHRDFITEFYSRVDSLIHHHHERLMEVKQILKVGGPQQGYEVAQGMTWRISCNSWEDFPRQQKWFATGEAISHLQHLFLTGQIKREKQNGEYYFSL